MHNLSGEQYETYQDILRRVTKLTKQLLPFCFPFTPRRATHSRTNFHAQIDLTGQVPVGQSNSADDEDMEDQDGGGGEWEAGTAGDGVGPQDGTAAPESFRSILNLTKKED